MRFYSENDPYTDEERLNDSLLGELTYLDSPLTPWGSSPDESCCPDGGPPCEENCLALLRNPLDVLMGRGATHPPKGFCYQPGTILPTSTEYWARNAYPAPNVEFIGRGITRGEDVLDAWCGQWPLPIGRESFRAWTGPLGPDARGLLNLMPFDGDDWALLALRVWVDGAVVDLLGKGIPRTVKRRDVRAFTFGPLVSIIRSEQITEDVRSLVDRARRWWGTFYGQGIDGRPVGSGNYRSKDEFTDAVFPAIRRLHARHQHPSKKKVINELMPGTHPRQLLRWAHAAGFPDWTHVLGEALKGY